MTLVRHLAAAVVLAVLLVIISSALSPFRDYQMAEVACYVVAVAGLTVLIGLSGQISLGNGAFMAIGALRRRAADAAPALAAGRGPGGQRGAPRRPAAPSSAWPRPGCAGPTWPVPR